MSKILLVDNQDSFTYNLYHYLEEFYEGRIEVKRNTALALFNPEDYEAIVISPGPGLPSETENLAGVIQSSLQKLPILGICLGHQAIANAFGCQLKNLNKVVHGQAKVIQIVSPHLELYDSLPLNFKVARYHSWVIDQKDWNVDLQITALDEEGNVMSFKHKKLPISAVQYHPESVLTEYGHEIIKNWLQSLK